MNLLMAIMTNHQSFTFLCYHHHFPRFFPFQVFKLVNMVNFILPVFSLIAAKLAFTGFQPAVYSSSGIGYYRDHYRFNVIALLSVHLVELREMADLLTCFRLIRDTPPLCSGAVLVIYL